MLIHQVSIGRYSSVQRGVLILEGWNREFYHILSLEKESGQLLVIQVCTTGIYWTGHHGCGCGLVSVRPFKTSLIFTASVQL